MVTPLPKYLLLFCAFLFISCSETASTDSPNTVGLIKLSHDFGDVQIRRCSTAAFDLSNSTSDPITITSISALSSELTHNLPALPLVIAPNTNFSIEVEYCPVGPDTIDQVILLNDGSTPRYELTVKGFCDETETVLPMNTVRATLTFEGEFDCPNATAEDMGKFWRVLAPLDAPGQGKDRVIQLDILKRQTSAPFTVLPHLEDSARIFYSVSTPSIALKSYVVDKTHKGTGTIKITHLGDYLEGTFDGILVGPSGESRVVNLGEFKVDLD